MVITDLGAKNYGGPKVHFRGPMVLDLGGQWSGANGLGGQSSI